MGGSAFGQGQNALFTPRMPRNIYESVREHCHAVLRQLFLYVASPIEGPEKYDFGDIDIFLSHPKSQEPDLKKNLEKIVLALDASNAIIQEKSASNLAIPWPRELSSHIGEAVQCSGLEAKEFPTIEKFIQIDVQIFPSLQELQWVLFKHAHGDIWNILGSIIRPYGLSADEKGLWVRIPEIEQIDKKRARIFLTSEPAEVLQLLRLPVEGFWDQPFATVQAMYQYASICCMFSVQPMHQGSVGEDGNANEIDVFLKELRSNDRRRLKQRPIVRRWVEEYIPLCRQRSRFCERRTCRKQILQDAFSKFLVEHEFVARRDYFLKERQESLIWNQIIKGSVSGANCSDGAACTYRGCLTKALKRIILDKDSSYGITAPGELKDKNGFFDLEKVEAYVRENQETIGLLAMQRHRENLNKWLEAGMKKIDGRIET